MAKLQDVVLIQIDCEKGEGIDLTKSYRIQGYPTFVLANPAAETAYRWMGYTKDQFISKVEAGFSDLTPIEEKQARFNQQPDLKTALALAEYDESIGNLKESVGYYNEAARLDPDNDYAYDLFQLYRWGSRKETFSEADVIHSGEAALESQYTDDTSRFWVLHTLSGYAAKEPGNQKMLAHVETAHKLITNKPDVAPDRYKMDISIYYTMLIEKDTDKAVNMKKANMPDGWMDDAGDINGFQLVVFRE